MKGTLGLVTTLQVVRQDDFHEMGQAQKSDATMACIWTYDEAPNNSQLSL